jgi:hypothetical protein
MSGIELREDGGRAWAALTLQSIGAIGRLNPRLLLYFTAQPDPYAKVALDDVTLRLEYKRELVGTGRTVDMDIHHGKSLFNFEVVTSPRVLRYITDTLTSDQTIVQFDATLSGAASYWVDPAASSAGQARMVNDPEPGAWTRFRVSQGSPTPLQVPRSEWYERVLAPTRNEQYLYLEVALPKDHPALVAEWNKAVGHLKNAEKAYAAGDDPGVFQYLRGWLDALPGAKKHILDAISDEKKRKDLDQLLTKAGEFLHNGRHVAADGTEAGEFPVNRLDAAFALDLMRVLLSHLSVMVAAGRAGAR